MPFASVTLKCLIPKDSDFSPSTFGEHVLKRRLTLRITQKELGKRLGVSNNTVFNWELGVVKPAIKYIPRLIEFLGYDPEPTTQLTIQDRLAAKRRELGWTQKVAARRLGVDPCTWSTWECGGTILVVEHRRLVAQFLGLPETELHVAMRKQWNHRHNRFAPTTLLEQSISEATNKCIPLN